MQNDTSCYMEKCFIIKKKSRFIRSFEYVVSQINFCSDIKYAKIVVPFYSFICMYSGSLNGSRVWILFQNTT